MRIGSLFAGYDGIGLALEQLWPDMQRAWFVEFDPAPSKILAAHWPEVPNYGDVTKVDWASAEPVDILTGGFPCQDLSHAGKRKGLRPGTRSGLWEHMAYAIYQLRPSLVVIENVRGLLSGNAHSDMEPCPWCLGDIGEQSPLRALGAVLGSLADIGYDARWAGVRAADAGAPHGRFRVFIVAQPAADAGRIGGPLPARGGLATVSQPRSDGDSGRDSGMTLLPTPAVGFGGGGGGAWEPGDFDAWAERIGGHGKILATEVLRMLPTPKASDGPNAAVALLPTPSVTDMGARKTPEEWDDWTARIQAKHGNGNGHGASLAIEAQRADQWGAYGPAIARWEAVLGRLAPSPTEPGRDGRPRLSPLFVEWMMGLPSGHVTALASAHGQQLRDHGVTPLLSRAQQLKALGNGVVPQQAALALRMLLRTETPWQG